MNKTLLALLKLVENNIVTHADPIYGDDIVLIEGCSVSVAADFVEEYDLREEFLKRLNRIWTIQLNMADTEVFNGNLRTCRHGSWVITQLKKKKEAAEAVLHEMTYRSNGIPY